VAKTKAKARRKRDRDITEWDSAWKAVAEACCSPLLGSAPRDSGKPPRVAYDDAMQRLLRLNRASAALADAAHAAGHPYGGLAHLRLVLDIMLLYPMSNAPGTPSQFQAHFGGEFASETLDTSDLRLDVTLTHLLEVARLEVLRIEHLREAAHAAVVAPEPNSATELEVLTNDETCKEIARRLVDGPLMSSALRRGARPMRESERTIRDRLRRMLAAGLVGQAKKRAAYWLTDDGRKEFGLEDR
jgi:hypothetical protein